MLTLYSSRLNSYLFALYCTVIGLAIAIFGNFWGLGYGGSCGGLAPAMGSGDLGDSFVDGVWYVIERNDGAHRAGFDC